MFEEFPAESYIRRARVALVSRSRRAGVTLLRGQESVNLSEPTWGKRNDACDDERDGTKGDATASELAEYRDKLTSTFEQLERTQGWDSRLVAAYGIAPREEGGGGGGASRAGRSITKKERKKKKKHGRYAAHPFRISTLTEPLSLLSSPPRESGSLVTQTTSSSARDAALCFGPPLVPGASHPNFNVRHHARCIYGVTSLSVNLFTDRPVDRRLSRRTFAGRGRVLPSRNYGVLYRDVN